MTDIMRAPWKRERFRYSLRWLGVFALEPWQIRAHWGEITFNRIGLGLELNAHGERTHLMVHLPFFWAFIYLPFMRLFATDDVNDQPAYGFHWSPGDGSSLMLYWGRRCRVIYPPWAGHSIASEFLAEDGTWMDRDLRARSWREVEGAKEALAEEHPYHYLLGSGETQHVTATVRRERGKRGWRWFGDKGMSNHLRTLQSHFVPWDHWLDISFSGEVGERAGSWKGGCTGCSWRMKPGETPLAALRRMQTERRFR